MTENFSSPTQTTVFLLALCPHLPAGVSTLVQASCRRSSKRWSERILDQSCLSLSCLGSLLHKFLDPGTFLLSQPSLPLPVPSAPLVTCFWHDGHTALFLSFENSLFCAFCSASPPPGKSASFFPDPPYFSRLQRPSPVHDYSLSSPGTFFLLFLDSIWPASLSPLESELQLEPESVLPAALPNNHYSTWYTQSPV